MVCSFGNQHRRCRFFFVILDCTGKVGWVGNYHIRLRHFLHHTAHGGFPHFGFNFTLNLRITFLLFIFIFYFLFGHSHILFKFQLLVYVVRQTD